MWCSVNIRFGLVDWNVQNTWGQYNHEPCTDLESTWLLKGTAVKEKNTGGWTYHAFIPSGWGSRVRNPWALNHDTYNTETEKCTVQLIANWRWCTNLLFLNWTPRFPLHFHRIFKSDLYREQCDCVWSLLFPHMTTVVLASGLIFRHFLEQKWRKRRTWQVFNSRRIDLFWLRHWATCNQSVIG